MKKWILFYICLFSSTIISAQVLEHKALLETLKEQRGRQIKKVGQTLNEQNHGRWVYFFEDHVKYQEGEFKEGKKVGTWLTYTSDISNSNPIAKETWVNGKMMEWEYLNRKGDTKIRIKIKEGLAPNEAIKIQSISNAIAPTIKKDRKEKRFSETMNVVKGSLNFLSNIFKGCQQESVMQYWNFNNNLEEERFFENGFEKLRNEYVYNFGVLQKKHIWKNEELIQTISYDSQNPKEKLVTDYYVVGYKKAEYNEHQETGKFGYYVEFYPNGRKKIEGEYKADKRAGKWKYWDENGKRIEASK